MGHSSQTKGLYHLFAVYSTLDFFLLVMVKWRVTLMNTWSVFSVTVQVLYFFCYTITMELNLKQSILVYQ